jgi:hypothetical protein
VANGEGVAATGDNGADRVKVEGFDGANTFFLFVVPDPQLPVLSRAPEIHKKHEKSSLFSITINCVHVEREREREREREGEGEETDQAMMAEVLEAM